MNLQDQVISFSVAKKINKHHSAEFGSGLFFWAAEKEQVKTFGNEAFGIRYIDMFVDVEDTIVDIQERYHLYPAFTTAELLNLLPAFIKVPGQEPFDCYNFAVHKRSAKEIQWVINYHCDTMSADWPHPRLLWPNNIFNEHLPDALAEALVRVKAITKVVNNFLT